MIKKNSIKNDQEQIKFESKPTLSLYLEDNDIIDISTKDFVINLPILTNTKDVVYKENYDNNLLTHNVKTAYIK